MLALFLMSCSLFTSTDSTPVTNPEPSVTVPDQNAEEQLARDIALAQEKAEVEVGEAVDELESRARAAAPPAPQGSARSWPRTATSCSREVCVSIQFIR